jgi:hypothetical protein
MYLSCTESSVSVSLIKVGVSSSFGCHLRSLGIGIIDLAASAMGNLYAKKQLLSINIQSADKIWYNWYKTKHKETLDT